MTIRAWLDWRVQNPTLDKVRDRLNKRRVTNILRLWLDDPGKRADIGEQMESWLGYQNGAFSTEGCPPEPPNFLSRSFEDEKEGDRL